MKEKALYCLNCPAKPCSKKGCPLNNDIPAFISKVKENKIEEAYEVLSKTTVLGSICGRICPHESQCQGSCVRGKIGVPVSIGELEAYVFDYALENELYKKLKKGDKLKGKKIAVIGSGPAGLTCSAFLAREGANVTIYEKYDRLGGLLVHGIPEFRLDREVLKKTINSVLYLGIDVKYGKELGENLYLEQLQNEYDAVFLGIGANVSAKMNIQGEDLKGVYGANNLLEQNNHPDYRGKKVAVIGGGNVAMDCARTIKRMGAQEVTIIYRRTEEQMPAERKEIQDAKNEGINFLFLHNIVKVIGKDYVQGIECIKTELVKKEGEKRECPVNIPNSKYVIDMDYVIMALGAKPEKEILENIGLELNEYGYLKVNEKYQTSTPKIYAGGDIIGEKATIAWAAKHGREVAKNIIQELETHQKIT